MESQGELESGAYRVGVKDSKEYISFSAFGHENLIVFERSEFRISIDGNLPRTSNKIFGEFMPSAEILLDTCFVADGIQVHRRVSFHPFHQVPLHTISIKNLNVGTVGQIEVEWLFKLAKNSPFAVLTSLDSYTIVKLGKHMAGLSNEPTPLSLTDGELGQINTLVLYKSELPIEIDPENQLQTQVIGDPSFYIRCENIPPNGEVQIQIPFWCLRSLRDTAGSSGIAYLVQEDDWQAAIACLSAPVRRGEANLSAADTLLGLYSPIFFYSRLDADHALSSLPDSPVKSGIALLLLIPPSDVTADEWKVFCNRIMERAGLPVLVMPPAEPREILGVQLWLFIGKLLSFDKPPKEVPETLLITKLDRTPRIFQAALTPGVCLIDERGTRLLPDLVKKLNPRRVILDIQSNASTSLIEENLVHQGYEGEILTTGGPNEDNPIDNNGCILTAEQVAAKGMLANLLASLFVINDDTSLRTLWEFVQFNAKRVQSLRAAFPSLQGSNLDYELLSRVIFFEPDLAIGHPAYIWAGPPSCVFTSLFPDRWQDAIIAAAYARAKSSPLICVGLSEALIGDFQDYIEIINEESSKEVYEEDFERELEALRSIQQLGIPSEQFQRALRLSSRVITLFPNIANYPWELISWENQLGERVWLSSKRILGRIVGPHAADTARITHQIIQQAHSPPLEELDALFAVDKDVDNLIGEELEELIREALLRSFLVDTLLPRERGASLTKWLEETEGLRTQKSCEVSHLIDLLSKEAYALVFMAGHGHIRHSGESVITLGGKDFKASDCPRLMGLPLILWNSCWGGTSALKADDPTSNVGLAVSFLSKGALQFISPLFPVTGSTASRVSREVGYSGLALSPARVLRNLKQMTIQQLQAEAGLMDTLWYIVFGDPTVSRFYAFDGIPELEDIPDLILRRVPVEWTKRTMVPTIKKDYFKLYLDALLSEIDVAQRWGRVALASIDREKQRAPRGIVSSLIEYKKQIKHIINRLGSLKPEVAEAFSNLENDVGPKKPN